MRKLLSAIDSFTGQAGKVVAFVFPVMLGVLVYEVILRFAFNRPTIWAHETATLVFGIYMILLGGYSLLHQRHIRVDILWARLSPRGKAVTDLATSVFGFMFLAPLLWYSVPYALRSLEIGETSLTLFSPPLYPSKIFLVLGVFWFLLQFIAKFIRDVCYTVTGRPFREGDCKND